MKKQRFLSTIAAVICAFTVVATNIAPVYANAAYSAEESGAVVYAEHTKWFYRANNGIVEKRLWSVTYGRWLTDWMPVNS